jgi:hypothetical protein
MTWMTLVLTLLALIFSPILGQISTSRRGASLVITMIVTVVVLLSSLSYFEYGMHPVRSPLEFVNPLLLTFLAVIIGLGALSFVELLTDSMSSHMVMFLAIAILLFGGCTAMVVDYQNNIAVYE